MNDKCFAAGKPANHIYPFTGVGADETEDDLRSKFLHLTRSGIYSMVLLYEKGKELQRFDEAWFALLERVAKVCRALGMTFWFQDAAPYPTGAANGAFEEAAYRDKAKVYLVERHTNVVGPTQNATILVENFYNMNVYRGDVCLQMNAPERSEALLHAIAMRKGLDGRYELDTAMDVTDRIHNGMLQLSVPDGVWRVFLLFRTTEGGRTGYMNLLDADSVAVQLQKVHIPHAERLKDEIGGTWAGIFYDEPEIGNLDGYDFSCLPGSLLVNGASIPLPWSKQLPCELVKRQGAGFALLLPCLWYDCGEMTGIVRYQYMDAVTHLVSENYNGQVYRYLHERGIGYLGHTLDDENSHAHLGCGPGHFFRAQKYQDAAGVDLICGQVIPGSDFLGITHYGSADGDGEFWHYGLAKLASSEGHINPLKRGRSICEYMALYGNIGTLKYTKFIVDHLLVNGINNLIPAGSQAFRPDKYRLLNDYANRICTMMEGSTHIAPVAILYHAESEWAGEFQHFHRVAKELATHQIDHDVVPCDALMDAEFYGTFVEDGLLKINCETYRALLVPGCERLPKAVAEFLLRARDSGVFVCFVDSAPRGYCDQPGVIDERMNDISLVAKKHLADALWKAGIFDIRTSGYQHFLRYNHFVKDDRHFYLLHNEEPAKDIDTWVTFPHDLPVRRYDAMFDTLDLCEVEYLEGQARIHVALGQWECALMVFSDEFARESAEPPKKFEQVFEWTVTLYPGLLNERKLQLDRLTDLGAPGLYPRYDGELVYETVFREDAQLPQTLDLGRVCDEASVLLNGVSLGCRVASPYVFDVSGAVRPGENRLCVRVGTNPARGRLTDPVLRSLAPVATSTYAVLEPVGMQGPATLSYTDGRRSS